MKRLRTAIAVWRLLEAAGLIVYVAAIESRRRGAPRR
jgi:hypothetical protein